MASVIVFGPTGQIGSVAARTAAQHGAKVWLAMRDTKKAIPGLDKDLEQSGGFQRVQADLQAPESVGQAVKTAGARRAFIYLAHGSQDHMKSTIEALKSAGIEVVVFLSSFTIPTNRALRDTPASEYIPYVHAQVEANLDDVYGVDNYIAVRPGAFITNLMQHQKAIAAGQVHLYGGQFEQDNISPDDIGRVAGAVLASGTQNGQKKVYVYGPKVRSIHDSVLAVGKTLGKDVKITEQPRDEAYNSYVSGGMPEFLAKYMCEVLSTKGPDKGDGVRFPKYDEGVKNVELYSGKASTSLEDWVRENEGLFSA